MSFRTGSAATYPTALPVTTDGQAGVAFRADPDSRIVYVVGLLSATASGSYAPYPAPLDTPFRPLTTASLLTTGTGLNGQPVYLIVASTGALTLTNAQASSSYSLRTFYFADTVPA